MRVFAYLNNASDLSVLEQILGSLRMAPDRIEFHGFVGFDDGVRGLLVSGQPNVIFVQSGSLRRQVERFLERQGRHIANIPLVVVHCDGYEDPFARTHLGQVWMSDLRRSADTAVVESLCDILARVWQVRM